MLPLFVTLTGRRVLLVGGGTVATAKLAQMLAAGAEVRVVAPDVSDAIAATGVTVARRAFVPSDLDDVWLAVAAAPPAVNRAVAEAAEARRVFVNAVDDPANATAYFGGVVRRGGVTIAVSTGGRAPALSGLLREALDTVLPADVDRWSAEAARQRAAWRRDGVPIHERRPLLLDALNRLYAAGRRLRLTSERADVSEPREWSADRCVPANERVTSAGADAIPPAGRVSIVGAGPGDPALLTRRAVARLRAADLVLYDALVDPRVLRLTPRARRFFVGKRSGRHAMTQDAINALLIRAARRGRRVVRLKGGDPFVFGRGGEEALALQAARVPFDVVPGVTSAVAAPALAGIPVTHRAVSAALLVVSGHDPRALAETIAGVRPERVTLVVLMGGARRMAIASTLIANGWPAEMPAAIVRGASTAEQTMWRGTVAQLAADPAPSDAPVTIVIGAVAAIDLAGASGSTGPRMSTSEASRQRQCAAGVGPRRQ